MATSFSLTQEDRSQRRSLAMEMEQSSAASVRKAPSVMSILVGEEVADKVQNKWQVALYVGPIIGAIMYIALRWADPPGLKEEAKRAAGGAAWIAFWWMTEALPLGVTSMLPLAIFPLLGVSKNTTVAIQYSSKLFWLFFGGIQLSLAIERSGLHRRLALAIIRSMGTRTAFLQLGLNLAVGVLSMFLSNTSTTVMLLPVALALVNSLEAGGSLGVEIKKPFMLGLAYSASAGGIGTIIGTATNGALSNIAGGPAFNRPISFATWSAFGVPLAFILIFFIWGMFVLIFKVPFKSLPADHPIFDQLHNGPGERTQAETRVGIIFAITASMWMFRKPIVNFFCLEKGSFEDDTVAIFMVISLFIVKGKFRNGQTETLMNWPSLIKMPWDLLFLFGAGLAVANAFSETGLSLWMGQQLSFLGKLPPWGTIMLLILMVTFLTEITSNVATTNVWLPVVGQIAILLDKDPLYLMIPTTLAASCAYMLPVATPPNAVVFGSGLVTIKDMASTGFFMSIFTVVILTVYTLVWAPVVFDFQPINGGGGNVTNGVNDTKDTCVPFFGR